MRFPISYSRISVKEYQAIHPLLKEKMELDDLVKVLAKLSGKSVEYIESIPIKTLKKYFSLMGYLTTYPKTKNKKYLFIKGKLYKADTDAKNLSTAQYCEIKEFCKDGQQIANLDKICASLYKRLTWRGWQRDVKDFDKTCDVFKSAKMSKVYGVVFFCSIALTHLMESTKDYLEALKIIQEREKECISIIQERTLSNFGDGTL